MFIKKAITALSFLTAAFVLSLGINVGLSFINSVETKDTRLPGRFTTRRPGPAKWRLPKADCVKKGRKKHTGIAIYEFCTAYWKCKTDSYGLAGCM